MEESLDALVEESEYKEDKAARRGAAEVESQAKRVKTHETPHVSCAEESKSEQNPAEDDNKERMQKLKAELVELQARQKAREVEMQALEDTVRAEVKSNKWFRLLSHLDSYVDINISTTGRSQMAEAAKEASVQIVPLGFLLAKRGIAPAAPLTPDEWTDFVSKITLSVDRKTTNECGGVHPLVQQVMKTALATVSSDLRIEFEFTVEEDVVVKKPDGALFNAVDTSTSCTAISALVIAEEFKLPTECVEPVVKVQDSLLLECALSWS